MSWASRAPISDERRCGSMRSEPCSCPDGISTSFTRNPYGDSSLYIRLPGETGAKKTSSSPGTTRSMARCRPSWMQWTSRTKRLSSRRTRDAAKTYERVSFTRQQLAAQLMCLDSGNPVGGGEAPWVSSTCRPESSHTDQALWARWTLCDACIPLYPENDKNVFHRCSGTRLIKPLPVTADTRLLITCISIFFCVSRVSVPIWGKRVICSIVCRMGLILGSSGKTSRPAAESYRSALAQLYQDTGSSYPPCRCSTPR